MKIDQVKLELSLAKNIRPNEIDRIRMQVETGQLIHEEDRYKVRLVQNGLRLPLQLKEKPYEMVKIIISPKRDDFYWQLIWRVK